MAKAAALGIAGLGKSPVACDAYCLNDIGYGEVMVHRVHFLFPLCLNLFF